jgi:hypothetical protein
MIPFRVYEIENNIMYCTYIYRKDHYISLNEYIHIIIN